MIDNSTDVAKSLVYNEYYQPIADEALHHFFPGYDELTPIQRWIFKDYVNHKKIIGSWSLAISMIQERLARVTEDDIVWAYAVGAGGGMEYEFPYE